MSHSLTQIPLQLDDFFLSKLQVEWRSPPGEGEFKVSTLNLRFLYDLATLADNPHSYQMTLSIIGEEIIESAAGSGFKFEGIIVGRYRLENAKPEMEPTLARVNGVSLLYSTFRGILGSVSGNFEHGKVTLPSIDPKALVENIEKERLSSANKEKAAEAIVLENPDGGVTVKG